MSARPKESEWQRRQRRDRERAEHVAQHGPACQICGNVPKRGLDQDHDHRTGKTRGWLDHRCNRALPNWITPYWLARALLYLLGNDYPRALGMVGAAFMGDEALAYPEKGEAA